MVDNLNVNENIKNADNHLYQIKVLQNDAKQEIQDFIKLISKDK